MQSTIPHWRGEKGWKSQRLDQKRETIFSLLNDSRLYKRETQLSYIKKNQIRCDPRHQMHRCWIDLLLMVVNESFYTVMHDIPYFPTSGNIWIPYKSYHAALFIRLCHVCFFPFDSLHLLGTSRWNFKGLKLQLCPNFLTPTALDYTTPLHPLQWSNRD